MIDECRIQRSDAEVRTVTTTRRVMGSAREESSAGRIEALVNSLEWHRASSSHRSVVHPSTIAERMTIARSSTSAVREATVSRAIAQDSRGGVGVRHAVILRGDDARISDVPVGRRLEPRCAESASTQGRAIRHAAVTRPKTPAMRPLCVVRRVVGVDLRRLTSHATTSEGVAVNG